MLARALSTVPVRVRPRPRPSLLSCVLCGDLCLVYRSRPPARVSLARRRSPIINYEGDGRGRARTWLERGISRKEEAERRDRAPSCRLVPHFSSCPLSLGMYSTYPDARARTRTSFFVFVFDSAFSLTSYNFFRLRHCVSQSGSVRLRKGEKPCVREHEVS